MAFNVISTIDLDMARPNADIVNATQYDSSGRVVRVNLFNNGTVWQVPNGVYPVIRYQKSDRIGGFYDVDELGSYAINFENNRATICITLALQVLTTAGDVNVQVNFYSTSGTRITSFAFTVKVQKSFVPDEQIVSSEYYNALTATITRATQAVNLAEATQRVEAAETVVNTYVQRAETAAASASSQILNQLPTLVSDWLSSHITNPSSPPLDRTLTSSSAAAPADLVGVINTDLNDVKGVINMSDLIDKTTLLVNTRLGSGGSLNNVSGYYTTDYIPVVPGKRYFLERPGQTSNYTLYRATYDANKAFIAYVSFEAESPIRTYDILSNVYYVRFSFSTNVYNLGIHFISAKNRFDDILYELGETSKYVRQYDYIANMSIEKDKRINNAGNVSTVPGIYTTDYIPVVPGKKYLLERPGQTSNYTLYRATYDANKAFIAYVSFEAESPIREYIIPSNVYYVRFSFSANVYTLGLRFRLEASLLDELEQQIYGIYNGSSFINMIPASTMFSGKRLNANGGLDNTPGFYTTDYVSVVPDKLYCLERPGQTSDYTIWRCTYDADKNVILYGTLTGTSPSMDYAIPSNVYYVRFSFSTAVYSGGIEFRPKKNRFDELEEAITSVAGYDKTTHKYNGEAINVEISNQFLVSKLFNFVDASLPAGKTAQAIAIRNNVLFQFLADDMCRLYDLANNGKFINDIEVKCGHGNSACFVDEYTTSGQEFPNLYVSDIDGKVYISNVTRTGSTLLRTLKFDTSIFGYSPQFAMHSNKINAYVVGNANNTESVSRLRITKCDFTNTTQNSDGTYTPAIVDSFEIDTVMDNVVLQGIKYLNGKIFMASGGHSTSVNSYIFVIDPESKTISNIITDFPEEVKIHELEDIEFIPNPYASKYDIIMHVRLYGYYKMVL